ncbi:fimbrial chaperone protein [Citrobacter amalonaticus]|uniref:Fimbrial chaperone protein n=2 Tax=Citrobacter amalonaticus TaxID=35703 RepID=A0A2S4RS29_CITAM|nr:fimbrial chaperone protein [Citrobacter amalonaticus]POT74051.1 fimbrial chaperone protein [Citrobacter amalonaticus]POU62322.1 fimbrial chaperone protein [Citrobacter amalonaticus]POV02824.1 fimbrial chaperone protein [Citrobacter amalonaticus]
MASVVMLNTRVIYPGDAQSETLQFTNNDNIPYIMQIWSDVNNPTSTPDNADGPFMAVPALFRIEPKTGQSVRLVFTGKNLPQDRESVFYLNSVQIPPKNMANAQNQMVVVLRNRNKIFYRPKTIVGSVDNVANQLRFSVTEEGGNVQLTVINDSGYYASFINADVIAGSKRLTFPVNMVPPKSQTRWVAKNKNSRLSSTPLKVKFTLVNDYGGHTNSEVSLKN